MSGGRLTDSQVADLADELAMAALGESERQAHPMAAVFAGQPGAGKTHVGAGVEEALRSRGGCVVVDADLVRPALPYQAGDSNERQVDAGRVAQELLRRAVAARRHVVVHGTLRDPDAALKDVQALRGAGYGIEIHALAVNDQISRMRAVHREQIEADAGLVPRAVPATWHDDAFRGSAASLRRLEYAAAVDRTVVYNRLGEAIHDSKPVAGELRASQVFEGARSKLTDYERVHLAREWDGIIESMERRGESAAAIERVRPAADRAHYTMRSSPAAAESFDYLEPASKAGSQASADRYGHLLATAFRTGDRSQARTMPELANAFTAEAVASRMLAQQGPAAPAALQAVRDRIAMGLQRGAELAPVQVREAPARAPQAAAAAR